MAITRARKKMTNSGPPTKKFMTTPGAMNVPGAPTM
jgi:hypothetical protein